MAGKSSYPHKRKVDWAIRIARDNDLDVAGFAVSPDGTIRGFDARSAAQPADEFERLEAEGIL